MLNWGGIFNVVASSLAVAGAAFAASIQAGASPEQAGISAGVAFLGSIINHLRGAPELKKPA